MTVKFEEMMRELFSPAERAAIRRTATSIAKRHLALRELRQARNRTQVSIARKLGVKQVNVSRLENREDPRLSTLTKYIDAMGGRLHLIVEFPEQEPVLLRGVGKERTKPKKKSSVTETSLLRRHLPRSPRIAR
jgi:transcriptional regulator with XRE-family HTH domain